VEILVKYFTVIPFCWSKMAPLSAVCEGHRLVAKQFSGKWAIEILKRRHKQLAVVPDYLRLSERVKGGASPKSKL
jgi:hypothetical protein